MTTRVRKVLSKAIPLPTTITEASAEYEMWQKRDRERQLVLNCLGSCQLDGPARFRQEIIRNLLEVGLRASSIAEVLIRQRYAIAISSQMSQPEIDRAVLLDLEGLVAQSGSRGSDPAAPPKTRRRSKRPAKFGQPGMFA